MAIRRLFFVLFAVASLSIYSCKENPRNFNSNLLGPDQVNLITVDSFTGSFPQSSTSFKTVIQTGASYTMLLGKYNNQVASSLIKFNYYLPDSIKTDILNNSATVTDAWVELSRVYVFGDSNGTFQYGVHKINTPWTVVGFTVDSLENSSVFSYDAADIGSQKSFSDSLTTFHISTSFVSNELKNYGNGVATKGIYLNPTSGNNSVFGYAGFLYNGLVPPPLIKVVINKTGVYTDTLFMDTNENISVVTGGLPNVTNSTDMIVQPMLIAQSRVVFDCSSIPADAVINKATLLLYLDTDNTVKGSSYNSSISAYNIADSAAKLRDSLGVVTLTNTDDILQGDITSFVQKWITKKQNQGILLTPNDGLSGMEIWAIKGSNYAQAFNRPQLIITYTTKQ